MKIKKLPISYSDSRGIIKDIIVGVTFDAVAFITSAKGAVRGNHFHKKTEQYDYILKGSLLCASRRGVRGKVIKKIAKAGDYIYQPAMQRHAYKALEYTEFLSFTYGPRQGKNYEKDVFRLEKPLIK